ncbi:MAG TPA: zinc ribbon domain-containing protein [Solirubrobacteraceae bacterium]|jgi:hypothetical protein
MSLAPVPSEQPTEAQSCANCAAPLAPDQRYCLACGHPVSPVRLAFLDVLQGDHQPYEAGHNPAAGVLEPGYAPVYEPVVSGPYAWLRRYSGLFGLLSVLLLAILAGLLVGHWVTQRKAPDRQVLKVEGLPAAAAATPLAAAPTATTASTAAARTPKPATSSKETAKTEAHEVKEAKAIEKAPPPKAVKVSPSKLQKLGSSSGQKHEEEVNKLGAQPIETGGG